MQSFRLPPTIRLLFVSTVLWTVTNTAGAQEEREAKAFGLQNALADEVARTLSALVPDAGVTVDPRTNTIIVLATGEVLVQVEQWIKELDEPAPQLIRIFPLSHRLSQETAELLNQVLKDDPRAGSVSIVADARANSLLVRAREEEFDHVEQLLRVIDMEPTSTSEIKVFALQNTDANVAGGLMNELFAVEALAGVDELDQLRIAVDERTNSLIVTGAADALSVVEALLVRLDEGDEQAPDEQEPLRIHIMWVVSGDDWSEAGDQPPRLAAIPDRLADVAGELESLGIGDPQIATQMVVNTSQEFSIRGSAHLENSIQVDVQGSVSMRSTRSVTRPSLQISIQAAEQVLTRNSGPMSLCELSTTLKAPLGHYVVLGVSPIDGRNSAFVVQVTGIVQ